MIQTNTTSYNYYSNALKAYNDMLRLKNYSANTARIYENYFLVFLQYYPNRKPSTITKDDVHPVGLKK